MIFGLGELGEMVGEGVRGGGDLIVDGLQEMPSLRHAALCNVIDLLLDRCR